MFKTKHLHVDHARAWFPAPWYGPNAKIRVKCAHDTVNPQLQIARTFEHEKLKDGVDVVRGTVSPEASAGIRDVDRKLYPIHVIDGWSGVLGTDGSEVPHSREAAISLLTEEHMPSWIFDELRLFCMRPRNFVHESAPSPAVMESVAGKSSSA